MTKVIATDLDGTLFYPKDKKGIIYEPNLFFIQDFIDKGGEVILITGRSFSYCKKVLDKIGRKCAVIAYNGACVYDGEKIIHRATIANEEAKSIIDDVSTTFKTKGVFLMTDKGVIIDMIYRSKLIRAIGRAYYRSQKNLAEDFYFEDKIYQDELNNGVINKINIFFGIGKKSRKRASEATTILRSAYDHVETNWSDMVIEITPKNASKSYALEKLCEIMKYDRKDVYVVGDSGNDISMFKTFPENSFCMSHSAASVKKHAKYVIDKFEDLSRYIYEK